MMRACLGMIGQRMPAISVDEKRGLGDVSASMQHL
jgi:hypothetical protein